MNEKNL